MSLDKSFSWIFTLHLRRLSGKCSKNLIFFFLCVTLLWQTGSQKYTKYTLYALSSETSRRDNSEERHRDWHADRVLKDGREDEDVRQTNKRDCVKTLRVKKDPVEKPDEDLDDYEDDTRNNVCRVRLLLVSHLLVFLSSFSSIVSSLPSFSSFECRDSVILRDACHSSFILRISFFVDDDRVSQALE